MNFRTWSRLFGTSFGAAAVLGAAQLGTGYGLRLLDWRDGLSATAWTGLLTWTAFICTVAVVGGAAAGGPGIQRPGHRVSWPARVTAAIAAMLGSAATVPLLWLPARGAHPAAPGAPGLTVLITAAAGLAVGLLLALIALSVATVAYGLSVTMAWVWAAALGSAGVALVYGDQVILPRLGVFDAPRLITPSQWWFGPEIMIGIGIVLAAIVSGLARHRGAGWPAIIASGLAGPALVASAYALAGPNGGEPQLKAYLAAMVAAGAAAAAAVLVAVVLPGRRPSRPARAAPTPGPMLAIAATPAALPGAAQPVANRLGANLAGEPLPVAVRFAAELPPPGIRPGQPGYRGPVSVPMVAEYDAHDLGDIDDVGLDFEDLDFTDIEETQRVPPPPPPKPAKPARASRSKTVPKQATIAYDLDLEPEPEPEPVPVPVPAPAKGRSRGAAKAQAAAKPDAGRPDTSRPEVGKPEPAKPEPTKSDAKKGKSGRNPSPRKPARGRQALRQRDLDHIDWVRNLVHGDDAPELSDH